MAVEPVLASTLWSAHQHAYPAGTDEPPSKRRKLATECKPLDTALSGGFGYGAIQCISAEADAGSKQLSHALIATHLLDTDSAEATIIDTTNSFDVRGLHQLLTARLQALGSGVADDARDRAVRVLDRVRIMKAFDFVGLTECVAEHGEHLEARADQAPDVDIEQNQPKPPRGTVSDSQDEGNMLESPSPVKVPQQRQSAAAEEDAATATSSLLIIDNITHVTAPLLKNSHVQGQALLTSFMRSLAHLTRAHDLCTVVHNAASTYTNSANTSQAPSSTTEDRPSIFSSCTLRPALGRSFAYLVDVHMLVHRAPLEPEDAKAVYGTQAPGRTMAGQRKMVSVLEVLSDRHEGRVGRWAAFHTTAEGELAGVT